MSDRELASGVPLLLIYLVIMCACAAFFLGGCAHARPPLWEVCRDACAFKGADFAAVVGDSKPKERKPECYCGKKPEAT